MTFSTKAERYAYKCGIDKGYANACLDAVNALKESERVNELLKHNSELMERLQNSENERRRLERVIMVCDPGVTNVHFDVNKSQAAAAALRMVGDAIEELFGSIASLESEEATLLRGPEHHHRAEAIIEALQRIRVRSRFTHRAKLGDYITQGKRLMEGWETLGEAINKAMPELLSGGKMVWNCNNCDCRFLASTATDPACPCCKAHNQYTYPKDYMPAVTKAAVEEAPKETAYCRHCGHHREDGHDPRCFAINPDYKD